MNTQTTYTGYAAGQSSVLRDTIAGIRGFAQRIAKAMMARHLERETVRELSSLPTYILRDIGMQREDIGRVAGDLARERADAWARRAGSSNGFGG